MQAGVAPPNEGTMGAREGGMSRDGMCPGEVELPERQRRLGGAWSVDCKLFLAAVVSEGPVTSLV